MSAALDEEEVAARLSAIYGSVAGVTAGAAERDQKPKSLRGVVDLMLPFHRRAGRLGKLLDRVSPIYSFYGRIPWLPDEARSRRPTLGQP